VAFNLFDLHDSSYDVTTRQLLRVYSVIPKFSLIKTGSKAEQAILVVNFLKKMNVRLKSEVSINWKLKWIKLVGYNFSPSSFKDWFIGRASIPLVALEKLKLFGLNKEVNELMQTVQYISTTTRKIEKISFELNSDLLYLSGLILGDGSLPITHCKEGNYGYKVLISSGDKLNLAYVSKIFEINFEPDKPLIYFRKNDFGSSWVLQKDSKVIYRFFTKLVGICNGNKAKNAGVPQLIKNMQVASVAAFLSGLVDSDIGSHGGGMGCTFRSKLLVDDLIWLLGKPGIKAKNYGSHFKENKYIQHGFSIPKSQIKAFKDVLEKNYLPKRKDRVLKLYSLAGVP